MGDRVLLGDWSFSDPPAAAFLRAVWRGGLVVGLAALVARLVGWPATPGTILQSLANAGFLVYAGSRAVAGHNRRLTIPMALWFAGLLVWSFLR